MTQLLKHKLQKGHLIVSSKDLRPSYLKQLIAEKIPEGLVVAQHTKNRHFYFENIINKLLHSTTTKMGDYGKSYLKNWSTKIAADFLRERINDIMGGSKEFVMALFDKAQHKHNTVLKIAGEIGSYAHEYYDRFMIYLIENGKEKRDIDMSDYSLEYIERDNIGYKAARNSFLKFIDDHFIIPIASELLVADTKYLYAGTFDNLVLMAHLRKGKEGDGSCGEGSEKSTSSKIHEYWLVGDEKKQKYQCINCGQKVQMHLTMLDWKTSNQGDKSEYAMQVAAYVYAFVRMVGIKPTKNYIVHFSKEKVHYNLYALKSITEAIKAYRHLSAVYDWEQKWNSKHFIDVYKIKNKKTIC